MDNSYYHKYYKYKKIFRFKEFNWWKYIRINCKQQEDGEHVNIILTSTKKDGLCLNKKCISKDKYINDPRGIVLEKKKKDEVIEYFINKLDFKD